MSVVSEVLAYGPGGVKCFSSHWRTVHLATTHYLCLLLEQDWSAKTVSLRALENLHGPDKALHKLNFKGV